MLLAGYRPIRPLIRAVAVCAEKARHGWGLIASLFNRKTMLLVLNLPIVGPVACGSVASPTPWFYAASGCSAHNGQHRGHAIGVSVDVLGFA